MPLGLTFGALLWCKLTTGPAVALLLLAWLFARRDLHGARRLACSCVAGGLLAVALWLAFAALYGLPAGRPLADLAEGLRQVAGRPLGAVYLVGGLRTAQWLHPLLLALLVAAPLALRPGTAGAGLLVAGGGATLLSLGKLAAGYPKYGAGAWPLLAAAAGGALALWLARPPGGRLARPWPWPVVLGALVGTVAGVLLSAVLGPDTHLQGASLGWLALWLGAGALLLALAGLTGPAVPASLALGLLLGSGLALAGYQAAAPFSTTYFYGSGGQVAAGRWLREALAEAGPPGALPLVVADREVAYYAGPLHYADTERLLDPGRGESGAGPLFGDVRLLVSRHERVVGLLPAGLQPVARFGDYRAWRVDCRDGADGGIPCWCSDSCGGW